MAKLLYLTMALMASAWTTNASGPITINPSGVTTVPVKDGKGASLSYKQSHVCETTPGVKSYAGFVHLPGALTGEDFDINTFYWFVEARENPQTAPLAIYLAGGPGDPSIIDAMGRGGPCYINDDYNSTTLNPWSWNTQTNMIYIDQPVQTGFSYNRLVNITLDQFTGTVTPIDSFDGVPDANDTFLIGIGSTQNPNHITQGSVRGASALWNFMQVFTSYFPKNRSSNDKISIWTNSWGGFYSTQAFALFERQNEKIRSSGTSSPLAHVLNLDTLGVTNGCIDLGFEVLQYPEIAIHNTYGFQAYSEDVYHGAVHNYSKPGGCRDLINECRALAAIGDPDYQGTNATVNEFCSDAFIDCFEYVQGAYDNFGKMRSALDFSHQVLDPIPDVRPVGFLNQPWVLADLGVPLNFSGTSNIVSEVYSIGVGDGLRSNVSNLEFILDRGYKVAMVFGDRDERCNWLGGENVSLTANWTGAKTFRSAGYANLETNSSYQGGYVRQTGGLSFSRVFQAGHTPMVNQPETVYRIFQRAMSGLDVATGMQSVPPGDFGYHTSGPATVRGVTQTLPPEPPLDCDLWALSDTCSPDQQEAIADGTAVLDVYKVVKPAT